LPADLDNDPRWHRLQSNGIHCATCNLAHVGVFDLGMSSPDYWQDGGNIVTNDAVETSTHFCSDDFCIIDGEHFFIRCILLLPIIGADGLCFGYGLWSSLSEENFRRYQDGFDEAQQGELGPWFGWLSNRLNGYPDCLSLKCRVHPQNDRQRPEIELEDVDHPLVHEQQNGITLDRLLEIYALNGHDFGSALDA
jgi:hypothetical protein